MLILLLVSALITAGHSWAADAPITKIFRGDLPTASERQSLASDLAERYSRLNQKIPTLSPSQEAWLQREYFDEISGGILTERSRNAKRSREYAIYTTKSAVDTISSIAWVAEGRTRSDLHEALFWAVVASKLMDEDTQEQYVRLVNEGIIEFSDLVDASLVGVRESDVRSDPMAYFVETQRSVGFNIFSVVVLGLLIENQNRL